MRQTGKLIYVLIDPRTLEVRYVGKSSSGMTRPKQHTARAALDADRGHKGNWLRQLVALELVPIADVIERLPLNASDADLIAAEVRWIAHYKARGCTLTNMNDGGGGAGIGNTNGRFTKGLKKRPLTPADLARRNAAVRAAYANWTPEQRAAHAAKISAAKQGSPGNVTNLSKGWSPEVRARALAASAEKRRGVPLSDEQKKAISEANKRAWAERKRRK